MRTVAATLLLVLVGLVGAQNLGETIRGLYGDSLGTAITANIPGYGVHAVVKLLSVRPEPAAARDIALPVFNAIASQIGSTVSVSIFAQTGFADPQYELVLQRIGDVTRVFLDGAPFDPP